MSQAWLLDLGDGRAAAVGMGELVHLLYAPVVLTVPHTPPHAAQVLMWDDRLLPLLDLSHWLRGTPAPDNRVVVAVIACHASGDGPVEYVALPLAKPPVRIPVEDSQACPLPEPTGPWQMIALAAFEHGGLAVPILDTARLASDTLPTALAQRTPAQHTGH